MLGRRTAFVCGCLLWVAPACTRSAEPPPAPRETSDARVRALADAFLEGFLDRNPDAVTLYGIPGRHHDRLPDNSLDALAGWRAREDSWLAQIEHIGARSFSTRDVPKLLQRARTDGRYRFKSREDLIAYSQAALARAKAAI